MNKEELLQQEAKELYPIDLHFGKAYTGIEMARAQREAWIAGRKHLPATNAGDTPSPLDEQALQKEAEEYASANHEYMGEQFNAAQEAYINYITLFY